MPVMFRPVPVECEPMKKNRHILTFRGKNKDYGSFYVQTSFSHSLLSDEFECDFIENINASVSRNNTITAGTSVFVIARRMYEKHLNNNNLYNIKFDSIDPTGVIVESVQMLVTSLDVNIENNHYDSDLTSLKVVFNLDKVIKTANRRLILEKKNNYFMF